MCKKGTIEKVLVKNLKGKWEEEGIDKCIAPIVEALQKGGIYTKTSCCGHGRPLGSIFLQDGRILLIDAYGEWAIHGTRFLIKAAWTHFIYPKRVQFRVARDNISWRIKKLISVV